jgi:hypothetical protein
VNSVEGGWKRSAAFLYFRATADDVWCVCAEKDVRLFFDGREVEWLHERLDMKYVGGECLESIKKELGLECKITRWQSKQNDFFEYTRHLRLLPRYKCWPPTNALYYIMFHGCEEVRDPYGGPCITFHLHEAVGDWNTSDLDDCWFRCSLLFFDALEKLSVH